LLRDSRLGTAIRACNFALIVTAIHGLVVLVVVVVHGAGENSSFGEIGFQVADPGFHSAMAYGGAADHLAGDLVDGENPLKLRDFLAGAPTRARYQLLERLAEGFQSNGARDQNEHNSDITKFLFALNLRRIADRLRRMPEYPLLKYSIAYAVGFSGKLPLQIADAGFPTLARTVEKCLVPRYEPGRQPQFTSVVSQLVRLAFAFGVDSSAWHMSFSPTLRSEANGNGNTDKEFYEVLRKDDPSVDLPWMELRSRASESWKALALRENLESGLVSCALALGPPYYP